MEFQEIEVFIDADGQVRIEVRGVKGMSCLELTEALEAALGGQIEARVMTAEAYESSPEQMAEQLRQQSQA